MSTENENNALETEVTTEASDANATEVTEEVTETEAESNKVPVEEALDSLYTLVNQANSSFKPALSTLTKTEKQRLLKMGKNQVHFVHEVLSYAKNNPEFVPHYMNPADVQVHMDRFERISLIHQSLTQLIKQLEDTSMWLGDKSYSQALSFYQSVRVGAKKHAPGAKAIYNDLKLYFAKSHGVNEQEEATQG